MNFSVLTGFPIEYLCLKSINKILNFLIHRNPDTIRILYTSNTVLILKTIHILHNDRAI